jgi:hypothetical protein
MNADHRAICRFSGIEDERYVVVWKIIKEMADDIVKKMGKELAQQAAAEIDPCKYKMNLPTR